jgi:oxygen-independent coproporphyrinogen-3 oxidase
VYVHVPYCKHRCPYCDFYLKVGRPDARFAQRVVQEWEANRALLGPGAVPVALYLGGGTPGLLPVPDLALILESLARPGLARGAEVTLEVNPNDVTQENVVGWRAAGVTRVSLGVQSLDAATLRALGRDHDGKEALTAMERLAAGGFASFSVDLIFGSHAQTVPALQEDLRVVTQLAPHVSAYCLTYEAGTHLDKRRAQGRLTPITVDDEADRYLMVQHALKDAGFTQYEVSSHARPGHHAVHNRLYWAGCSTLGLGPAGASYLRFSNGTARRWRTAPDLEAYLGGTFAPSDEEDFDPHHALLDRMFAGVRDLERGLDLAALESDHGVPVPPWAESHLQREVKEGALVRVGPRHFRLTQEGALVGDRVARGLVAG